MAKLLVLFLLIGCVSQEETWVHVKFDYGNVKRDCLYLQERDPSGNLRLVKRGFDPYYVLPEVIRVEETR